MMCRAIAVVVLVACGSTSSTPPPRTFGGDRPVNLQVPSTVEDGKRYPLVVVLHGFGANGFVQEAYFGMSSLAADDTAFVLAPDGTTNSLGKQFWNADPNCCDHEHQNPDDVAYLGGLIDEVSAAWPIDPKAVVVIGHSNGGYMAYRLACDRADVIGDIVVLAGQAASTTCTPSRAVNVLHIHGSPTTPCRSRSRRRASRRGPRTITAGRSEIRARRSISTARSRAARPAPRPRPAARRASRSSSGPSKAAATSRASRARSSRPCGSGSPIIAARSRS